MQLVVNTHDEGLSLGSVIALHFDQLSEVSITEPQTL